MRGLLIAAAGLLFAAASVQAQPTSLAATQPNVHEHVATSLLYRPEPEKYLSPMASHPVLPPASKLPAYPTTLGYSSGRRTYRPHIEYIERTYVVVEDSLPTPPTQAVPTRPPQGRKK